jgi:hypothetical protein
MCMLMCQSIRRLLTDAFSNDTIWALSVVLITLHLMYVMGKRSVLDVISVHRFFDYGDEGIVIQPGEDVMFDAVYALIACVTQRHDVCHRSLSMRLYSPQYCWDRGMHWMRTHARDHSRADCHHHRMCLA